MRSYFMDNPSQGLASLIEKIKKHWEYARIFQCQWNTRIMDDDGNLCPQKQLRAKLGPIMYDYSNIYKSITFLGIPMLEDVPYKKVEDEARENSE